MAQLKDSLITGDLRVTGTIYGNTTSATKLQNARTIAISGGATGTATSFDGSGNITIPVTGLDMNKANAGTLPVGRGGTGATTFTSGNVLVGAGTGAITTIAKTNANTANTLVQRDGSGNFSAGTITANLTGHASSDLALSGGTMTGVLTLKGNQYEGNYAMNANNSDIIGLNRLAFQDASDSANEGIDFYRDSTHWDTVWANGGNLYFTSNRPNNEKTTAANSNIVLHTGNYTTHLDERYVNITGDTMSGDLLFSSPGATAIRQIRLQCADNDYGRIAVGGTASNSGYMEIATADDASEPIYVRQYSGVYTTLNTTLTLLDGSHNTTIPGRLTMSGGQAINQILTGTGTAASDKGSGVSPRYFPAKWTFNTGRAAVDGDIYTIKIPVAGHTYGVFMSVNNGTNYYPVVLNGTGRITTHYAVNTYLTVIFESTGSAADMYALNGADARATVSGGVFRVINFYDSNSNTIPASWCGTAAATAAKAADHSNFALKANSYTLVTMRYANSAASAITLNINGTGAKPIYINGSASSASNYTLPAGTYIVFYNGTNYYFRTDAGIQGGTWFGNASSATNIYSSASTAKAYVLGTTTASSANHATVYNASVYTQNSVLFGAAWNDYAEFRKTAEAKPGQCVREVGDGSLVLTTKRLEKGCEIVSDTYGFAIGETDEYKTPIAATGRVLAYPYEDIEEFKTHIGDPVCSGPNGTVSIMTEEEEEKYSSRIIGTISEIPTYETWGTGNVEVNGRVWIRIR